MLARHKEQYERESNSKKWKMNTVKRNIRLIQRWWNSGYWSLNLFLQFRANRTFGRDLLLSHSFFVFLHPASEVVVHLYTAWLNPCRQMAAPVQAYVSRPGGTELISGLISKISHSSMSFLDALPLHLGFRVLHDLSDLNHMNNI